MGRKPDSSLNARGQAPRWFVKRQKQDEKTSRQKRKAEAKESVKMTTQDDFSKEIREAMRKLFGGNVVFEINSQNMSRLNASPPWSVIKDIAPAAQAPTQREAQLEDNLRRVNNDLDRYKKFVEELNEKPHAVATVTSETKGGRGVIHVGSLPLEVRLPEGTRVGDQVRVITETNQPDSKLDTPAVFGDVVTVDRVMGREVFYARGDTQKRAMLAACVTDPVEAGDRVCLDPSGSVALQNLGREKARFTVSNFRALTWDEIGGLEEAKEALREAVEYPTKYAETYRAYGQSPSKGVLLYGPPGCGKTLLARAVATSVGAEGENGFIYVKGGEILSKWVGESEQTVRSIFDRARDYYRKSGKMAVVFIDEADALLGARGEGMGDGRLTSTLVPTFLAEMDGLEDSGAFVILSTNRPNTLDPAIVRDGRIDRRVRVGRPSKESTADIFRLAFRGRPCADVEALVALATDYAHDDKHALYELNFEEGVPQEFVRLRDMLSGAVIEGFVKRAAAMAIRRDRGTENTPAITWCDIESAIWQSFEEMAAANHNEIIGEKMEELGRSVTAVRKATINAAIQETEFRIPLTGNGASEVQRPAGHTLN